MATVNIKTEPPTPVQPKVVGYTLELTVEEMIGLRDVLGHIETSGTRVLSIRDALNAAGIFYQWGWTSEFSDQSSLKKVR